MKKTVNYLKIVFIFIITSFSHKAFSQLDEVGIFLGAGADDAEKLMSAYLEPFVNSFGSAINGGWYNTAQVHKPGGFDITLSINTAMVPSNLKTYDLSELDLNGTITNGQTQAPTFSEKFDNQNNVLPTLQYTEPNTGAVIAEFEVPNGIGAGFTAAPIIQAGIGLFKDTEIDGRYVPNINFGQTQVGMWGIGLKHGLKQWIPALKRVPIVNFTLQGAYTRLNTSNKLSVTPSSLGGLQDNSSYDWNEVDQSMNLLVSGFTSNLIFSLDVPVFSIYAGAGIATSSTTFSLDGPYPIPGNNGVITDASVEENTDPMNVKIENEELKTTKPRLNAGMRFKFAVITLHFDYTYANYNVFTGGLGISWR
jgi:hypothetical protein